MNKTTIAAVFAIPMISALCSCSESYPPWRGEFKGEYLVITEEAANVGSSLVVYASVPGPELFTLSKNDECIYLSDKKWEYLDVKDGSAYAPVFCPKKGAGWGYVNTLDKFKTHK